MSGRGRRAERGPILIVTEGATEMGYLNAIRDYERTPNLRRVIDAKGGGGVIGALSRTTLDAFAQVWVVLDAEAHPHRDLRRVTKWVASQPNPKRFRVVVTAPRFEAWLLAHYEVPEGTGRQVEAKLSVDYNYRKPRLPPGFPLLDWHAAVANLAQIPCQVTGISGDREMCAACRPGSAMIHVVQLLWGESG
ncbi:MAG: hypothetical protein QG597_4885 [Actinomycetota bacterium]|nr:hypothetical protein [Actinomycetota bacterium]